MSSIGFRPDNWLRDFAAGFDLTTTSAPTPDSLSSAPAAQDLPGPQARTSQFSALVSGWLENPIFGAGHGTSVRVIRSNEQPYAYELSYLALLFHTGLVGFLLYASGVIWIFYNGVRLIQSGDELAKRGLPVYVGTACFLIANATNPYLEKFDYMWVIFCRSRSSTSGFYDRPSRTESGGPRQAAAWPAVATACLRALASPAVRC